MLDKKLLIELREYIDSQFGIVILESKLDIVETEQYGLEKYMEDRREDSFAQVLFRFIDNRGIKDTEIYKKACIDRRHFSKIRSNTNYRVSKPTAIALSIALELNKTETETLLAAAGFTLSNHDTFDLIIQFFLEKEIYHIDEINQALNHYNQKTLC